MILLLGAMLKFLYSIIYATKIWLPTKEAEFKLGIIGLIPVILTLFALIGIILGPIALLFAYHALKSVMKIF